MKPGTLMKLALAGGVAAGLAVPVVDAQERPSDEYVDVTTTHVPLGPGMHVVDGAMIDVDHDSDLDIVVAVEHGPNALFMNDGLGRLTWKAGAFDGTPRDNEHVRAADFKDGKNDVFIGGWRSQARLLLTNKAILERQRPRPTPLVVK